ncbi:MAG: OmpA family protein, partial [Bacteroidota bacterium]|nr:OmpA family protein [Bacteroidota bacterium]
MKHKHLYIKILSIVIIILAAFSTDLNAQRSARKLKNKADKAYSDKEYYKAIDFYQQYCSEKPEDFKTVYLLAGLQRHTRDYRRARLNYQTVYKNNPEKFPFALFYYAALSKQLGEYDLAKNYFEEFLKNYKGRGIDRDMKKLAGNELEGCKLAGRLLDSVLKVVLVHADTSINKAFSEFSPLQIDDTTLIFASMHSDSINVESSEKIKKFYYATKNGKSWKYSGQLAGPFNNEKSITGNGVFSASGKRFYFTRCNKTENSIRCEIYQSLFENGIWQNPERIGNGVNDYNYTSTQPAVATYSKTSAKEIIYFVSDRPGGKGGLDIWYSIYDVFDKTFSEPRNAGRKINSIADESTPFFDEAGRTLYFSSKGHPGMGGFDIFKAMGEKRNWTIPQNIGFPLNSGFDDLYFSVYDRKQGFFTSNRDGGIAFSGKNCCDDIYSYYWTEFISLAISGEVREAKADDGGISRPLENAQVNLYLDEPGIDEPILLSTRKSSGTGFYFFDIEPGKKYNLLFTKEGFFSRSFPVSAKDINYSDTLNYPVVLNRIPEKPLVIEHVYFSYGNYELSDTAKRALDNYLLKLMKENPEISLEIFAHTDSKGEEEYNIWLSQKRAHCIVDYLTKNGISPKRLIAKGYGESRPIAPNKNPDGTDNP